MTTPYQEAVLVAGATETHYRRAGAGSPVVVFLFPCSAADSRDKRLFEALATRCRVIAPLRPPGVPFSGWLRDVVDGLGLDRPSLVVDESFAGVALGFALVEEDRLGAVVVVCRDHPDPLRPAAVADRLERCAKRLLVVALDATADASTAVGPISAFIGLPGPGSSA